MPTTQVINYQQDPGQKQMLDASKDIADSLYKAQSLKLTANYYKILAQNAQTDQEKAKFERWAKLQDFKQKIIDTTDPNAKAVFLQALKDGPYQGDANTMMHDLADTQAKNDEVYKLLHDAKPEPGSATEGQLRGAQVASYLGAGAKDQAEAAYYNDPGAFTGKMMRAMQDQGAAGSSSQGGYLPGDIQTRTPGGSMTFTNTATDMAKARATALGSGAGKKQVDLGGLKLNAKTYLDTFDDAIKETGGASRNKLEALFKGGLVGTASSYVKQDSAVAAMDQIRDPLSLQLADYINGGRPTEPDKVSALKLLPHISYPRRTNKLLKETIKGLFTLPSTGDPEIDGARRTEYVANALKRVEPEMVFADRARKLGKTDAEINDFLEKRK